MKKHIQLFGMCAMWMSACTTVPDVNTTSSNETLVRETEAQSASDQARPVNGTEPTAVPKTIKAIAKEPKKRFEPLIYGAEKDLVCTTPVLAKGKLKNRPNMQVMWENYLYDRPEGIWGEIGGKVEVNGNLPFNQGRWTNACAVRVSHMLNKVGHKIPRQSNNKTVSGGNKDQYIYRLADLEAYLTDTYGEPDINISDGTANSFDLPITPGIVLMDFPDNSFTGHVTIWNGGGTVDGVEIGGYRVLFWNLPCFIPEDRVSTMVQGSGDAPKPASP